MRSLQWEQEYYRMLKTFSQYGWKWWKFHKMNQLLDFLEIKAFTVYDVSDAIKGIMIRNQLLQDYEEPTMGTRILQDVKRFSKYRWKWWKFHKMNQLLQCYEEPTMGTSILQDVKTFSKYGWKWWKFHKMSQLLDLKKIKAFTVYDLSNTTIEITRMYESYSYSI